MNDDSTTIILVRHGQTEWNRIERFRGRADVPLNATGHQQAEAVASRMSGLSNVAMIYSSPLSRCLNTAAPIAAVTGAEIRPLAGIIDLDYGEWQGLTPAEVRERDPEILRAWQQAPHLVTTPGGESVDAARERAVSAMEEVVRAHSGQTVVLVSHEAICRLLVCHAFGIDNSHFWQIEEGNGAVNIFVRRPEGYVVRCVNETCRLR